MKLNVSGVTATSFYIVGVVVGSSFGFMAGVLFLAVVFLVRAVLNKKEKEIDLINPADDPASSSADENTSSAYQA